jgi:hypothetical protein
MMSLKSVVFIFLFGGIIVSSSSCKKDESFAVTPDIAFVSLVKYTSVSNNDSLELIFDFTDGDGDLGSPESNTSARDIFVTLFELQNGVFVEANLAAPLEYRMPFLEPSGNNSSLKGSVNISIDYNILQVNDTIRYELFIKDRAGHQSNTITSSTVITRVE